MVTFAPDQLPGYAFRGTVVSPSPGRRSQGLSQWPPVSYGRIRTWTGPEPKGCYQTIDDDLMQHVVLLVASILLSLSGLSYSPSWSITGVPRNGNSSSLEKAGLMGAEETPGNPILLPAHPGQNPPMGNPDV
ncbi:hypothetical protein ACMYSQ_003830 [Aspergillus niger]